MLRKLAVGAAVAAIFAPPVAAQVSAGQFAVGPRIGYIQYGDDTGIKEGALIGLDGMYYLNGNIGVGFLLNVARPSTDSSFFPAEMSFGDTTFVFGVKQPLTVVQFAIQAEFTTGGRFAPFISGSVGGYRISLDPQVARGPENFVELGLSIGGGIALSTSPGTSVRLEVRDFVFTDFDRSRLDPVAPAFTPTRFPDVLPEPDPFFGSAHNIQVALAFSFTPGGSR